MPGQNKENFTTSSVSNLSEKELLNYMKGLPVLLFRIEMVKNRIEYLNDCHIAGLGEKTFLLLKNRQLAKELVFEEDFYLYESFIHSINEARPTLTVIRIRNGEDDFRWLKLIGSQNSYNPGYYLGMIVDITDSIRLIEEMNRKEDEQQTMLELVDNPVVLVDMKSDRIVSYNAPALELFSYSFEDFAKLSLNDILQPVFFREKAEILEEIIFEKRWKGKMLFRRKSNAGFMGEASLRVLKIRERRLLRISVYSFDFNVHSNGPAFAQEDLSMTESRKIYVQKLLKKVNPVGDIQRVLEILLNNPYDGKPFDGILYSDIQIKKDKVVVYAVGETFEKLKSGESFAYEGTIAENIENYKLDHLIVEDTMSSIKTIDWALFIPHGIRSYFAMPFFERNSLRSILILCSRKPAAFSEEKIPEYSLLNKAFVKGLKNWRKSLRSKKS